MLLLIQLKILFKLLKLLRRQISENFQNSVTDREACQINILKSYVFWVIALSFESKLSGGSELFTRFAILLISYYSHKYFILHQIAILCLLKCNEKLKRAELSDPGVSTAGALKLKIATLLSLQNKKLVSVPLLFVFHFKYFCKRFLTCPLNLNPLHSLTLRRYRNILMAINVVFNLLYICLGRFSLCT